MCTAIEEMRRESMEQGREQGMEEGMEKGMEKAIVEATRNVMKSMGFSAEQAMQMIGIPDDEQMKYKTLL